MGAAAGLESPRIGVFASFSGQGGVERMLVNLLDGFVRQGVTAELVLARARGAHLDQLPDTVRLHRTGASHTLTALPALVHYLRHRPPVALLAAKDRALRTALLARRLSGYRGTIVGRLGTTVSAALADASPLRRQAWYRSMRLFYRHADGIVAVSEGVADDICRITGLARERISVIPNPVITPSLYRLAEAPPRHPWLGDGGDPVLLGVGRLTGQKDFPTLLRAARRVNASRPCRVVLLGEGNDRAALARLAAELGMAGRVALPGFDPNPYAAMARAAVLVLSSRWEGSPNVLTEAMALGTSVVATDCPSGPREILRGGSVAPLVPVGDEDALAGEILQVLEHPPSPAALQQAVAAYDSVRAAEAYLRVLGVAPPRP